MVNKVQDEKSEFRALINNILTFLILAVMTWVGVNITQMKDALSDVKVTEAQLKLEVGHLEEDLEAHADECDERWNKIEAMLSDYNEN